MASLLLRLLSCFVLAALESQRLFIVGRITFSSYFWVLPCLDSLPKNACCSLLISF
jgi:hypothetical protein